MSDEPVKAPSLSALAVRRPVAALMFLLIVATVGAVSSTNPTGRATAYLGRSLDVEPYDVPTFDRLAVLYEERGMYPQAVQARRAILALSPVDKANAYYELARSLYQNNEIDAAKRAVLQSLELAPGYREAQKLLLDCVDNMP